MNTSYAQTWRDHAACRDMDVEEFFPGRGAGAHVAKKVCRRCPAITPCLDEALALPANHDLGVRGGLSEQERRRLRRDRRRAAAQPLAPVVPLTAPAVSQHPRRAA